MTNKEIGLAFLKNCVIFVADCTVYEKKMYIEFIRETTKYTDQLVESEIMQYELIFVKDNGRITYTNQSSNKVLSRDYPKSILLFPKEFEALIRFMESPDTIDSLEIFKSQVDFVRNIRDKDILLQEQIRELPF